MEETDNLITQDPDTTDGKVKNIPYIGHKSESPAYQVDPDTFLEDGYRICFNTYSRAFRSLFMIHNETVNVWTHLIGAFAAAIAIFAARFILKEESVTIYPLLIHIISTAIGLSLSSIFHLLGCTSGEDFQFFQKLDYVGILIIASGTIISPLYYGFMCPEHFFWRYLWIGTAIGCCGLAAGLTMCQKRPVPWINGLAWLCAVLMGCPGFIHLTFYKDAGPEFKLAPWAIGASFIGLGMSIYALRIPERIWPKRFDFFGSSH